MKTIKAEIITIGDEILYGQITDTNTQFISQIIASIGIKTIRKSSVGDIENDILRILFEASQRVDLIILTGGLGPTKDDITKHTLCKFFEDNLQIHEPTLKHVTSFFEKRGREMLEVNKQQAAVPSKAKVLFNDVGTAPGLWIEKNKIIYISLPGVPYEMKYLMEERVLPQLKIQFETPHILHKMIHTSGLGESFLAEKIKDWENNLPKHIKLAYLPSLGIVKLRLTAIFENEKVAQQDIEKQVLALEKLISPYIFGYDENSKLQQVIGQLLQKNNQTIAVAESCTGGKISHLITQISGSSNYFKGSIVAYSNQIKIQELGVSESNIYQYGAVSEPVIVQMAKGIRKKFNTDFSIATSGIAGPNGGNSEKPVGTVWIAVDSEKETKTHQFTFGNLRENNIELGSIYALKMLFDVLY